MRLLCSGLITMAMLFALNVSVHAEDDTVGIQKAIESRLQALHNVTCSMHVVENYAPLKFDPPPELKGYTLHDISGLRSADRTFIYLNGNARYEEQLTGDTKRAATTGPFRETPSQITIVTKERNEHLMLDMQGRPDGAISNAEPWPRGFYIEAALGLKLDGKEEWLRGNLSGATLDVSDKEHVVAEWTKPSGARWRLVFDSSLGYALSSYEFIAVGSKKATTKCVCRDFRAVGTVQVPFRIEHSNSYWDGNHEIETKSATVVVSSLLLDDKENTPVRYLMIWPKGSRVLDTRTKTSFTVQSGDRTLPDDAIAGFIQKHDREKQQDLDAAQQRIDAAMKGSAQDHAATSRPSSQP